jgi:uncharacterized protein YxjI
MFYTYTCSRSVAASPVELTGNNNFRMEGSIFKQCYSLQLGMKIPSKVQLNDFQLILTYYVQSLQTVVTTPDRVWIEIRAKPSCCSDKTQLKY